MSRSIQWDYDQDAMSFDAKYALFAVHFFDQYCEMRASLLFQSMDAAVRSAQTYASDWSYSYDPGEWVWRDTSAIKRVEILAMDYDHEWEIPNS